MRRKGQLGPCLDWLENLQQNKFKLALKEIWVITWKKSTADFEKGY